MSYAAAIVFVLVGLLCVGLVAVGLPGLWILLAVAVGLELTDHLWLDPTLPVLFGWLPIVLAVGLGVIGEILEFVTGALGTKVGGGGRRGMVGALVGGLLGALVGSGFLPIIGTLLGALVGTFIGALVGEMTGAEAKQSREALPAALAATAGRIVGTVAKLGVAVAAWLGLSAALLYHLFA